MRVGIEKSRNLMTARLAMAIGMPVVQDYAKKFNINADLPPYLSMALGAGETTLVKITAAYGQLVNGGLKVSPSLIDRVQDRYGKTIMRHDNRRCQDCIVSSGWKKQNVPTLPDDREQLTDPASAYQIITMLEGVIKRGTGRKLQETGLVLAGKTGTTNDNTNAWFVGFSPDLVAGVFVGFDTPRPLGKRETGSSVAVPIFKSFMTKALSRAPQIPFRRPDGVNLYPVHAEKGYQVKLSDPNVVMEVFKPGQSPSTSNFIDLPEDSVTKKTIVTPDLY
jgi:penicillin-binding protein 1A